MSSEKQTSMSSNEGKRSVKTKITKQPKNKKGHVHKPADKKTDNKKVEKVPTPVVEAETVREQSKSKRNSEDEKTMSKDSDESKDSKISTVDDVVNDDDMVDNVENLDDDSDHERADEDPEDHDSENDGPRLGRDFRSHFVVDDAILAALLQQQEEEEYYNEQSHDSEDDDQDESDHDSHDEERETAHTASRSNRSRRGAVMSNAPPVHSHSPRQSPRHSPRQSTRNSSSVATQGAAPSAAPSSAQNATPVVSASISSTTGNQTSAGSTGRSSIPVRVRPTRTATTQPRRQSRQRPVLMRAPMAHQEQMGSFVPVSMGPRYVQSGPIPVPVTVRQVGGQASGHGTSVSSGATATADTQPKPTTSLIEKDIFDQQPNEHFAQPVKKRTPVDYLGMCSNMLANFELISAELERYQKITENKESVDGAHVDASSAASANVSTPALVQEVVQQVVHQVAQSEAVDEKKTELDVDSKGDDATIVTKAQVSLPIVASDPVPLTLRQKVKDMTKDVEMLRRKLQQMINIGKCFNKRDIMLSAFANTSQNFVGTCPSTKGDFDRKYLECPRALEDLFDDGIFGNPIGSDLNFVFQNIDITQIVLYMDKLRQTTDKPVSERLMFGAYRLDKIFKNDVLVRTEKNVPHIRYTMVMTDTETKPEVSIRCNVVNALDVADVRVQSLDYYGQQIFDAIPDLVLRRVVHSENVTKYVKKLTDSMPREQRLIIWESILRVLEKDIQYLNQGYRYVDIGENKMIKISVEEKEACPITMMAPPYTKVHLACEHQFSIMAIYGIVYEGKSDDTESIVCPVCRRNLIPKLVPALSDSDVPAFTVKTYKEKDIKTETDLTGFNFEQCDASLDVVKTLSHTESNKYIDAIFDKSKDSGDSNSDDDDDQSIDGDAFMNYLGSMFLRNA